MATSFLLFSTSKKLTTATLLLTALIASSTCKAWDQNSPQSSSSYNPTPSSYNPTPIGTAYSPPSQPLNPANPSGPLNPTNPSGPFTPTGTCPLDIAQLSVCVPILGGILSEPLNSNCCALLGIIGLDIEVCLCAAIDANILGLITIHAKIDLVISLLTTCGYTAPPNLACP